MTVGVPAFVLTEWLPPNGNHSGCVFVWDESKGQGNYQVSDVHKLKCCRKETTCEQHTAEIVCAKRRDRLISNSAFIGKVIHSGVTFRNSISD